MVPTTTHNIITVSQTLVSFFSEWNQTAYKQMEHNSTKWNWRLLPDEIVTTILLFFNPHQLLNSELVCATMHNCAQGIWKQLDRSRSEEEEEWGKIAVLPPTYLHATHPEYKDQYWKEVIPGGGKIRLEPTKCRWWFKQSSGYKVIKVVRTLPISLSQCLYDYVAEDSNELSFKSNDTLYTIAQDDNGWFYSYHHTANPVPLSDIHYGNVPSEYLINIANYNYANGTTAAPNPTYQYLFDTRNPIHPSWTIMENDDDDKMGPHNAQDMQIVTLLSRQRLRRNLKTYATDTKLIIIESGMTLQQCTDVVNITKNLLWLPVGGIRHRGSVVRYVNEELAQLIYDRIALDSVVQSEIMCEGKNIVEELDYDSGRVKSYKVSRVNSEFRILRYDAQDEPVMHIDGCYTNLEEREKSFWSIILYLNEGFEGGQTLFPNDNNSNAVVAWPKTGMIVVFSHELKHQSVAIGRLGVKYKMVLRTDLVFSY